MEELLEAFGYSVVASADLECETFAFDGVVVAASPAALYGSARTLGADAADSGEIIVPRNSIGNSNQRHGGKFYGSDEPNTAADAATNANDEAANSIDSSSS